MPILVGDLSTVPAFAGMTTFSIASDPTGRFSVVGNQLFAAAGTPAGDYTVSIHAASHDTVVDHSFSM